MLLVCLITAWLINRILLAPIKRLTKLVNGLAGDESGVSAHLAGDRELEEVSQRFEQMASVIRQRERALNRRNGLYAVLSHTNKIIIHDVEPRVLFERFCEIAVNYGEFAAAWVGEVDLASQQVRPLGYRQDQLLHEPLTHLLIAMPSINVCGRPLSMPGTTS